MKGIIYLDNAATTCPKPPQVVRAVSDALTSFGNPGRSGHRKSLAAANAVYACRENVCRLFGFDRCERVVFCSGATVALNMAIKGYAAPHTHILISDLEHNSVIRPVHALSTDKRNDISYGVFQTKGTDDEICRDFVSRIRANTKLAVITHASNVTGKILPVGRLCEICKKRGIFAICDVAQTAGEIAVNVTSLGADVLCFPAHKGLFGPQGCGGMLIKSEKLPKTVLEGGNGIFSRDKEMRGDLPEFLEVGTLPTPAVCGLDAGIRFVTKVGIAEIHGRNTRLAERLSDNLANLSHVKVYNAGIKKTGIVLFNVENFSPEDVCEKLSDKGICLRGGLHCAPLAHVANGTLQGAVRASVCFQNTLSQMDETAYQIGKLFR